MSSDPAPDQPRRPARRKPWLIGLAVIAVLAAAATAGTLLRTTGAAAPSASPAASPTFPPPWTPTDPGQRFLRDVLDTPGLSTDMPHSEIIELGRRMCDAIGTPGVTREVLVGAMGTTKFGPQVAEVLVAAAERSYCPERSFSTAPAVAWTPEPTAAAAAGPRTSVSDGIYEVGPDMAPGKYKTPGPGVGGSCYFEVSDGSGSLSGIDHNDNISGPGVVTLKNGKYFKTNGGCTWSKAS